MKLVKISVVTVFLVLLLAGIAEAGKYYEGWGKDPAAAMEAAKANARKDSPAKCLCKDSPDKPNYERDCNLHSADPNWTFS